MGHVLLVACLIALFSLGNAQEYLALEINVDGTDHKLYLDACFDQEVRQREVVSRERLAEKGWRRETIPALSIQHGDVLSQILSRPTFLTPLTSLS